MAVQVIALSIVCLLALPSLAHGRGNAPNGCTRTCTVQQNRSAAVSTASQIVDLNANTLQACKEKCCTIPNCKLADFSLNNFSGDNECYMITIVPHMLIIAPGGQLISCT